MKCPGITVHCPGCKGGVLVTAGLVAVGLAVIYLADHVIDLIIAAAVVAGCLVLSVALAYGIAAAVGMAETRTVQPRRQAIAMPTVTEVAATRPNRSVAGPERPAIHQDARILRIEIPAGEHHEINRP